MSKLKIYIASRYDRREEMESIANQLEENGFYITSSWVYGGEEGLDNEAIAELDLNDIDDADLVLSFTESPSFPHVRGGRHVEFGYGLARGKEMIIIGPLENVFHWVPEVRRFNTLEEFISFYS